LSLEKLIQWLKGKLICSWKGHKKDSYEIFVVEKTIVPRDHEIIDGRNPNSIQLVEKYYGDCGHIETVIYCKRCGDMIWKT